MKKRQPFISVKRKLQIFKLMPVLFFAFSSVTMQAQSFAWVKNIGGSATDNGYGVAVDDKSNVFVTGYTASTNCDFNIGGLGGTIGNAGGNDAFLAKYDAGGNFIWAKNMGGNSTELAYSNTVDKNGNVYVTGYWGSASADFNIGGTGGIITNNGGQDAFLAKYDNNGAFLWAKSIGGSGADQGYNVATDSNGNVFVAGHFNSTNFNPTGSGGTLSTVGSWDIFLAKYDSAGNYLWAKNMGGSGVDYCYGLDVDANGNAFISGRFDSQKPDFNINGSGGQVANTGTTGYDAYVAKYDPNGNFQWVKVIGGGGNRDELGYSLSVDPNGNSYTTGWFVSSTFQPQGSNTTYNTSGGFDMFIVKYDPSGVFQWTKTMGGKGDDYSYDVAADGVGNIYMTGGISKNGPAVSADFNIGGSGGTVNYLGDRDAFIAKYDVNGNFQWVKAMGGTNGDNGNSLAVSRNGNVFGTGYYWSDTANFNVGGSGGKISPITSTATDAFLVKFGCNDSTSSSFEVSIPCGSSYDWNESNTYTKSGSYTQVFQNVLGCDSMVTLLLTILPMEKPVISVDSFTLGVVGNFITYQWLKNGSLITGATNSTYVVLENGKYTVIVFNENGCSDTSEVYSVTNYGNSSSINEAHLLASKIRIYPNPATGIVHIQSPVKVNVEMSDITGKLLEVQPNATSIPIRNLSKGIYFLNIRDENGTMLKVEKLVKIE